MFNDSFLRLCRILRFVKKLDFPFLSLGGPRHGARVWCLSRVPKHRNLWQEVEGLLFSPKKLSVGAYFELLFLGCGFLIHLSNRSPWQELLARSRGLVIQPPKLSVGAYFELSSQAVVSLFIFSTGPIALDSEPRGRYVKNMIYNRNRLYTRATGSYALALDRDTGFFSQTIISYTVLRMNH